MDVVTDPVLLVRVEPKRVPMLLVSEAITRITTDNTIILIENMVGAPLRPLPGTGMVPVPVLYYPYY